MWAFGFILLLDAVNFELIRGNDPAAWSYLSWSSSVVLVLFAFAVASLAIASRSGARVPRVLHQVNSDVLRREEAERRFRSIFDNAVEGIFQTSPDGAYLNANPSLARIYGYPSVEVLTASLRDIERQLYVDPRAAKNSSAASTNTKW